MQLAIKVGYSHLDVSTILFGPACMAAVVDWPLLTAFIDSH